MLSEMQIKVTGKTRGIKDDENKETPYSCDFQFGYNDALFLIWCL